MSHPIPSKVRSDDLVRHLQDLRSGIYEGAMSRGAKEVAVLYDKSTIYMITQLSNCGHSASVKKYISNCQIRQDVNDIDLKVWDTNCVLRFSRGNGNRWVDYQL